jgi:hypothetical protein
MSKSPSYLVAQSVNRTLGHLSGALSEKPLSGFESEAHRLGEIKQSLLDQESCFRVNAISCYHADQSSSERVRGT